MTMELDDHTWSELERNIPKFGTLNARRVNGDPHMLIAVDHDGYRHGLFALSDLDQAITDNRSRGLTVIGRALVVDGATERPYLDLTCTDGGGNRAFSLILNEIIQKLLAGMDAVQAVTSTLARWRRFWASVPNQALSEEQVKGLFGELWFLHTWLLPLGERNILHWMGPTGTRHDFQWPEQSVEVKTTSSIRGHIHRISGLDQLEPPEGGGLYVYSLRVRQESNATNSLPALINAIARNLEHSPNLLDVFEQRLTQTGYSPIHADYYVGIRFRVVNERLFVVGERFPKITEGTFADGVPTGVERVEYEINLEGAGDCLLGSSAQEAGVNLDPQV